MKNQNLLDNLAIIEAKMKELSNEKDAIRKQILEEMIASGETKLESTLGKVSITQLKKWEYPEYVTEAKENYDLLKAKAEASDATFIEVPSLKFTPIKL